ncbi:unnamed protein product [Brassica rapa subsp. narinosa]
MRSVQTEARLIILMWTGLCKAVAPLKSLSRDPLKLTLSRSQALSSSNHFHAQALSSSNPLKLRLSLVR